METFLSVVVAEDNADEAMLLQRAFNQHGLVRPIHIFPDGSEVIAYLEGRGIYTDRVAHPFPDILILDLKMPRISGFEVLDWIQKNPDYRVIPAIVWSGSADRRDVKHAFCLGAHAYLCKPTDYSQFVEMVRAIITFWTFCEKPGIDPGDPECATLKDQDPFSGARFH